MKAEMIAALRELERETPGPVRVFNERGACLLCGHCTRYGCEVNAKSSAMSMSSSRAAVTRLSAKVGNCAITSCRTATGTRARTASTVSGSRWHRWWCSWCRA